MEKRLNKIFTTNLINALDNLTIDHNPDWGVMTAKQMLNHLIQSSKMIHFGNKKLLIKERYIEQAIAFLYNNEEIKRGLVVPNNIGFQFDNKIINDIEQLKIELINSSRNMLGFLNKNTDFKAIHPFFGELNANQWILFQRKHYKHHLSQFRLL